WVDPWGVGAQLNAGAERTPIGLIPLGDAVGRRPARHREGTSRIQAAARHRQRIRITITQPRTQRAPVGIAEDLHRDLHRVRYCAPASVVHGFGVKPVLSCRWIGPSFDVQTVRRVEGAPTNIHRWAVAWSGEK